MAKQTDKMQYTECFVAFIDVLGFSDLVRRSCEDPHILAVLTRALNAMAELPSGTKESRHQDAAGNWIERRWQVQTRAFSDTVVIFMPKETGSISQVLFMVRYLHDRMLELGLCMRGAVTIGDMYWHDAWSREHISDAVDYDRATCWERGSLTFPVTLGPGLIEAYKLESECAVYPRVLVSRGLHAYAAEERKACAPFGPYHPADRLLTDFFRTDNDGLHFLDLLHPDVTRNDTERIVRQATDGGQFAIRWERDGSNHGNVMTATTALIDGWLRQRDCPEKIRAKYEWLKSYAAQMTCAQPTAGGH